MSKPKTNLNSSHRKNFVKLLEKAARTNSIWNVFNDFLTISALSLSNSSDTYHIANSEEIWNQREQQYLDTINKYDKTVQPLFHQMFAELVLELEDAAQSHCTDVLGEIFGEMGFHDKWQGQFFTPQHISDLMALMTIDSDKTKQSIAEKGYFTICDPCCGGGSLIIGAINAMRELGLNHSKQMLAVACDIDIRCCLMSYIQLSLYGVPAVIIHQDSLLQKTFGAPWYTPVFVLDGWTWRAERAFSTNVYTPSADSTVTLTTTTAPNSVEVEPIADNSTDDEPFGQLSLF